jgi:hypothetical protein
MTDAQRQLHQALKARNKFDLEIERGTASDDLEDRIEATGRVLKWLEQALEPATFRQAQPEASTLHQDVNLLLGKTPRARLPRGRSALV